MASWGHSEMAALQDICREAPDAGLRAAQTSVVARVGPAAVGADAQNGTLLNVPVVSEKVGDLLVPHLVRQASNLHSYLVFLLDCNYTQLLIDSDSIFTYICWFGRGHCQEGVVDS